MTGDTAPGRLLTTASVALWAVVIFLPLAVFVTVAVLPAGEVETGARILPAALRSVTLATAIAAAAVLFGWVPGRLLGTSRRGGDLLLLLLLMPLVLPRYVLYYAWTLLLSPTTQLGAYLSGKPELARLVGTASSSLVLVLWYWPLAALLIAQGWRSVDRQVWECASLDADRVEILKRITLPLLARPLMLAFAVCFVLGLSEFATFDLAGVQTIGTELAVLYEETGSESHLARAAWPVVAVALVLALALGKGSRSWGPGEAPVATVGIEPGRWQWILLLVLLGISLIAPIVLLIGNMTGTQALRQFLKLHPDDLTWSLATAGVAAAIAYLIAFGALSLESFGSGRGRQICGALSFLVRTTIFLVMFVPASIVAVSLLKLLAISSAPMSLRQGWYIVSAGQAARFAGVALILLLLTRSAHQRALSEMASLDGASSFKAWLYVHLPHTWPLFVGTFLLLLMFSITELSATMVLLPAGLPNFAQRLLNQMHYARDQQVIASCLVLICLFLVLAVLVVFLLRIMRMRWLTLSVIFAACAMSLTGCDGKSRPPEETEVLSSFGESGRGQGQFIHPRAIDITTDGTLFIVDKTGRIQKFGSKGNFLATIEMPLVEMGKPTGLSVAPNGNLYVADTHYHRVLIFSPEGEIVDEFGKFGEDDGCFIYPTDVAFSEDGRIFVSEYGGNDRVSVFTGQGDFLFCFGSPGGGRDQFGRPSALCLDKVRKRLYVADACNHRIAIYNLDGELIEYFGSTGRDPGQLRYPYDLTMLADGTLVVCEYGNNRVQLFDAEGQSLAVYGRWGRRLGELACPWGVAVDAKRRAFIVDRDNMRIQVWQL
jgi:ABC-type Fe3+ transport system permease subunit/DNA-binding beta-propeller fold protein YncE